MDYGVAGQHVWKTTNLSAATPTWTAAGNGIPDVPVSMLLRLIQTVQIIIFYAGTDIGVYNSTDGGANWNPMNNGPSFHVSQFLILAIPANQ